MRDATHQEHRQVQKPLLGTISIVDLLKWHSSIGFCTYMGDPSAMEGPPGCLFLPFVAPALLLSVVLPQNVFSHHSFWGRALDLLVSVIAVQAQSQGVQQVCAILRAIALMDGRSGVGLLLVPFYPLAVFMYWITSLVSDATGVGLVSHGFLGTLLGGTLVAGPVMAQWWFAGTMKYLEGRADVEQSVRDHYDDWYD